MKKLIRRILAACAMSVALLTASSVSAEYEYAWFPAPSLDVTQLPYETASHGNCNALDILPHGRAYAPFTGVIKQIDRNWGFVLFQSLDKVHYANGKLDYMTVGFLHDENISTLKVGQVIKQGTKFYDAGGQGQLSNGSYGHYCDNHIDMSVLSGKVNSVTRYGRGDVYAYNAFYINPAKTTSIVNKGKKSPYTSLTKGSATDWSSKWKTLPKTTTQPAPTPTPTPTPAPIPTVTRPNPTRFKSVKNNLPRAISIVWSRVAKVDGYKVQIATNRTFTTGKRSVKIVGNRTTELIFKGRRGKTYYIRVRSYKGKKPSTWTKVKKVTITY